MNELHPPKVFFSDSPAIQVMFLGEPRLQPVVRDKNDLMFAVNTNWDIFYYAAGQRYYLLNGDLDPGFPKLNCLDRAYPAN